jgi:hypothetical protein
MQDRIILLEPCELNFPFESKANFNIHPYEAEYNTSLLIEDQFPCYTHDHELVERIVKKCEKRFPVKFKPTYYIVPFECNSRTNGVYYSNEQWKEEGRNGEARVMAPYIVLWGKRIPIMPAMTRYLVSHEISHGVEANIAYKKGYKQVQEFTKEYMKVRGLEYSSGYGGKKWHTNSREIVANDIRILVFGEEKEFWPHPCTHPEQLPHLSDFWYEMMLNYGN